MELILHRINTIQELSKVPTKFGVEIDIRGYRDKLILHHEPFHDGDLLTDFLDHYQHGTLVLNIKESGTENMVLNLVKTRGISDYFLLDCEYPYILNQHKGQNLNIAARFSCEEPIENINFQIGNLKWVWIDSFSKNPIKPNNLMILKQFKTCLVCPSRWNNSHQITEYIDLFKEYNWTPSAVMTSPEFIETWDIF